MATQISKKKKFVADGVLFAELNELLTRELAEEGYSGVEVRVTPSKTEVVIRATRTQSVLGEKGRRIRELTSVVQKRFGFPENSVELFVEKVANRGLCAIAQAESLRYKLVGGLAVRRACYGVLRYGKFLRYLMLLAMRCSRLRDMSLLFTKPKVGRWLLGQLQFVIYCRPSDATLASQPFSFEKAISNAYLCFCCFSVFAACRCFCIVLSG